MFSQYTSSCSGIIDFLQVNSPPVRFAGSSHSGRMPFLKTLKASIVRPSTSLCCLPSKSTSLGRGMKLQYFQNSSTLENSHTSRIEFFQSSCCMGIRVSEREGGRKGGSAQVWIFPTRWSYLCDLLVLPQNPCVLQRVAHGGKSALLLSRSTLILLYFPENREMFAIFPRPIISPTHRSISGASVKRT